MMKYDYINRALKQIFYQFGGIIAIYPYHFVFIPIVVFFIMATGFARLSVISGAEYLYVPTNSRALKERNAVEELFPPDMESLDTVRMTRISPSASVIIEAKDGGSIFRKSVLESARQVDDAIKNITIISEGIVFKYEDLCFLTSNKECFKNKIIDLQFNVKGIQKQKTCIRYPVHYEEGSFSQIIYAIWLGGVTTDENGCIHDAKAIRLLYYLNEATQSNKEIALKWEEAFLHEISEISMKDIYIYNSISSMLDRDASKFTKAVIPVLYVAFPVMLIFAVVSCMTSDWITSKPWIGVAAFISPTVAVIGAFGLLLLFGMEYPEFNISIPILMLAIGLDDSFVLLSAWRRTDPGNSVDHRMRETYSEAAVSITITSLTNLISFSVGMTTPYRVHRNFFIYASLSVVMSYISEITFFGGMLALSGYREAKNLHALFFVPVKQRRNHGKCKRRTSQGICCYVEEQAKDKKELVTFYRDKLGVLFSTSWAKVTTILIFITYLAGGIYGLLFLKEGLSLKLVFPPTSYAFKYIVKNYEYFSHYPHIIQIVVHETLDYSNPLIQKDIEEILSKFATANNMAGTDLIESWLRNYLISSEDTRLWFSYNVYNISQEEDFIAALKSVFLKLAPFYRFNKDIIFNENKTEIIASRFMVISRNISDGYQEADLIEQLWKIADSCKYPVYVHNARFVIQSLSAEMKDICIRTILTSTLLAMIVFVLTVPHLLCILLVGVAIASVEICVIGYMSLWNVGLDIVSSTALIISTGLSVDYLAHISYAYIICEKKNPNEKMRCALHAAGHPVFQGCFSTILLACTFPVASAYAYVVLFKIILLLMLFAGFSALALLPVSLIYCETFFQIINRHKLENIETVNAAPESSSLMNSSLENELRKTDKVRNV